MIGLLWMNFEPSLTCELWSARDDVLLLSLLVFPLVVKGLIFVDGELLIAALVGGVSA